MRARIAEERAGLAAGPDESRAEPAREKQAGREEHHRKRADDEQEAARHLPRHRRAEHPHGCGPEREHEHHRHRRERRRDEREPDRDQIDQQHRGPEGQRERLELQQGPEHQQQRERREKLAPPRRRRLGPAALEHERKGRVQHGMHEIGRERPALLLRGQACARPRGEQQERGDSRRQVETREFFIVPREREQARIGREEKCEPQPRRERSVADQRRGETEGHNWKCDRGPALKPRQPRHASRHGPRAEEERAEGEAHDDGDGRLGGVEKFFRPPKLHHDRAAGAKRDEVMPPPVQRDRDEAHVEHREVAEEARGVVASRREQDRCEEAAEDAEHRDHLRLEPHREQKRRRGHERHQQERRDRPEEREVVD